MAHISHPYPAALRPAISAPDGEGRSTFSCPDIRLYQDLAHTAAPDRRRPRMPQEMLQQEMEKTTDSDAGSGSFSELTSPRNPIGEENGAGVPTVADSSPAPSSALRTAILNFSSQWFLVPQGTGITSVVLFQLESCFSGLDVISYIVWGFTTVSLALMLLAYAVRAALYPRHVLRLLASDPAELACVSSVSIAFTSVNQMIALTTAAAAATGTPDQRQVWAAATVVLWWANAAAALASMLFIPYAFARVHAPGMANLSPATQLPMVAAITLAAGGGVVVVAAGSGLGGGQQVPILSVSYLSLALALPVAVAYSTMYLVRLVDGSQPARAKVYQEMIFCGPWGQGSFALQALGHALLQDAAGVAGAMSGGGIVLDEAAVRYLGYSSVFLGFLSWGGSTFWWAFAIMSCVQSRVQAWIETRRRSTQSPGHEDRQGTEVYSLAAWSLVFPWGVYTNAAVQLGKLLGSRSFRIWSSVLTVGLVILMLANIALTAKGLWDGRLLGIDRRRRRKSENMAPPSYR